MATLLSLIIVDDERIIREGLRDMVDWHGLGFHVHACLDDGRDAIAHLEQNHIDAVLTDIKMDDASGIEVARYVAENHPDTRVVVLSGYRDFTYAQQAVEYNVFRYLVKPVDFAELETAFTDIRREVDESRSAVSNGGKESRRWEDLLPQARRQFFADLLGGVYMQTDDIADQLSRLELAYTPNRHPCVLLDMTLISEAGHFSETARRKMLKTITGEIGFSDWYEIRYSADRLVILAVSVETIPGDEFEKMLTGGLQTVCAKVKDVFSVEIHMSVHAIFTNIAEIGRKRSLFEEPAGEIELSEKPAQNPIVDRVLGYLNTNYGPEVSLSSAAEKAFLSPVYFSRYIKEHTGKTFIEHLTEIRIQRAIALLRENRYSIGRIAELVGYANPRYFSKVFRKQTGYGPREYRINVLSKERTDG